MRPFCHVDMCKSNGVRHSEPHQGANPTQTMAPKDNTGGIPSHHAHSKGNLIKS